jgi:uncharacterized protein YneF (UPF0154 family)
VEILFYILGLIVAVGVGYLIGLHSTKKMIERRLFRVLEEHSERLEDKN